MKHKSFAILLLIIMLIASSGSALAQGPTPGDPQDLRENSYWFPTTESRAKVMKTKSDNPVAPELDNPAANATRAERQVATPGTSAVVNGNFELGRFVGWAESSSNGYQVVSSPPQGVSAHSGGWIAWLGDDDYEHTTLSQTNLSISLPTTLRLWYWIGSGDECGWDYGYVKVNSSILHTWNLCYDTNTYGWVPLDINLNAYNGQTVTLSIEVQTDESWPSGLLIDDVSLYGTFSDVPYGYWSWGYVQSLYNSGVTSGCDAGLFCPASPVTRDQMAVFLLKAKYGSGHVPPSPATIFSDVPMSYWAASWIEQFAAEGITSGCSVSPSMYCPQVPVGRDQMAIFLLRAKYGADHTPPPATGMFLDVPTDFWAAPWIEQLANEGITGGCGNGNYCPTSPVSRAEMAVFLVKTFNLP